MLSKHIALWFITAGLVSLFAGLFFGVTGSLQYLLPDLLKEYLPFIKTRPLHVTLVTTWIFTGAVGSIYFYIAGINSGKLFSIRLAQFHFIIFILTGLVIITCYFLGYFGGKEYLEFPPVLSLSMLITWILFAINFFMTIEKKIKAWPVYLWMWSTGIIFFMISFGEAYLWTLPYFGNNLVREMTVQWKAMGAMIGSWNMLIYGTAFYVMEQISGNVKLSRSPLTFFFYFLGLTNLMFNWGHHIYVLPAASWIKDVSYIISMTELLILGNIIREWKNSITEAKKNFHRMPYRFLTAADVWIFLNLILAILISIPVINKFTHGTFITVAHAMGATIGINSMILFASLFLIAEQLSFSMNEVNLKRGFWIANGSLFLFWFSLIGSGVVKSIEKEGGFIFQQTMQKLSPWFHLFAAMGIGIFIGILLLSYPLFKNIFKKNSTAERFKHAQVHQNI